VTSSARTDPRWTDSEPRLVELLRDEILAAPSKRVTLARFMQRALAEPGLGYYATSQERPTRAGDFLTAPELHPFFGRCLGRQLTEVWQRLGEPAAFTVQEHGAGRGTLADSVAAGLEADDSRLINALRWDRVDLPVQTQAAQPEVDRDEPFDGVVLANEFLDALPVHGVVARGGVVLERYVTWRYGWFSEIEDEPSSPELAAHLERDGVELADGQLAEIGLAATAWVRSVADCVRKGALLLIDYGHAARELYGPRRMAGTLLTYRRHAVGEDPLVAIGHQDLTAHVDLTAIERAAGEAGLDRLGITTQAQFLVALGLGSVLDELGRNPGTRADSYLLARSSVARLLDPRHLGAFHVLLFGRGIALDSPLLGFSEPRNGSARSGTGC
jgi:SAM-dependent MidA family methyltransferase